LTELQARRRRRGRGERGQALVEFSLVAIAFFLLVFGIFDMARLFQSWVSVQHAAREGARYAITGQILCPGYVSGEHRRDCTIQTAKKGTTGMNGGGISGADVSVSFQAWDYNTPSYDAADSNEIGKPCDQLEVSVTYTHGFVTPVLEGLFPGGVTITGSQRMTNEPFGKCTYNDDTNYD